MMNFRTAGLSVMMFLQFFVWGSWYVSLGLFMENNGLSEHIGTAYTVGPIAAIISPFFLGLIADRLFATERVLATMHLLGAATMAYAPFAAQQGPTPFLATLLVHMLCYMPTLGLTNTLAFQNMQNQEKEFPLIRVFGTIGWIVANLAVSYFEADRSVEQFYIAAGAGVFMGLFSFVLPHTPPPSKGKKITAGEILGVDAWGLLKDRSYAVFLLSSFLICIPLAAYYNFAGVFTGKVGYKSVAAVMSIGQMSEIVFMLLMPLFFARLGVKYMLIAGMLGWVVRYGLFSAADVNNVQWMVILGIVLHGICYDFFFVTGFIYTDKKCDPAIRGQAQGLLVLVTQGLGLGIGAQVMNAIRGHYTTGEGTNAVTDWQTVWMIPAVFALVILIFFALLFKNDVKDDDAPVLHG